MAFPILAVIGAALSDRATRQQEQEAVRAAGQQGVQRILRTRANELGGSPYGGMAADFRGTLGDITRQADEQRNNNIGALLQSYLSGRISGGSGERFIGENNDIPTVDDLGAGSRSGLSMVDDILDDPWGGGSF